MRSVAAVAVLSGPIVLSGYFVGSIVATWTSPWRRIDAWVEPEPHSPINDALFEVFVVLALSTAAWWAIEQASPGSNFSRIGYFSDQVLSAWQSVALWTALAVVAGLAAPIFHRFVGGNGLVPAAVLLAVHFPLTFFGAAAATGVALAFGREPRDLRVAGIGAILPVMWLGWVLRWESLWGLPAGPEATVWAMVLTMVLAVRWWGDRNFVHGAEPF